MKDKKEKDLVSFSRKLIEIVSDPSNAKQYYQTFLKNKNKKSMKRWKIITQQQKTIENSNKISCYRAFKIFS